MTVTLHTSKIIVRPFQAGDAQAFQEAAVESVDTVGQWLPWCYPGFSVGHASGWIDECSRNIAAKAAYDLGIFSVGEGRLLGGVAINQINRRYNFGNLGYWVRQSEQHKGIATEAVQLMIPYGFDVLGLSRLEIAIIETNRPSRKVAEKVGAVFEGIARNRLVKDGKPVNAAIYSLIP